MILIFRLERKIWFLLHPRRFFRNSVLLFFFLSRLTYIGIIRYYISFFFFLPFFVICFPSCLATSLRVWENLFALCFYAIFQEALAAFRQIEFSGICCGFLYFSLFNIICGIFFTVFFSVMPIFYEWNWSNLFWIFCTSFHSPTLERSEMETNSLGNSGIIHCCYLFEFILTILYLLIALFLLNIVKVLYCALLIINLKICIYDELYSDIRWICCAHYYDITFIITSLLYNDSFH